MNPKRSRSGHVNICPRKDGKSYTRWVHRLVLTAFVGECPEGMECRHLNGDPSDNRLTNLKWDTLSENRRDRNRHGDWNKGESHPLAKLSRNDVDVIRSRYAAGGCTQLELARDYKMSQAHVSDIIRCVNWKD